MSDCISCVVRNRAIFSTLNPGELGALSKLGGIVPGTLYQLAR